MCNRYYHRHHPILCILPPYVLRNIADKGTPAERAAALDTIAMDNTFRAMRAAGMRTSAAPPSRSPAAAVVAGKKQRSVYDCHHRTDFPGKLARGEGQPETGDAAIDEAYDGLGATYDLYWEVFERNSIDNDGMPLSAHAHYGRRYNNAFWDGQRMVFGDGDGRIFKRFTIAVDVIGHELSHGVVEDEGPLYYIRQSGALNESMADVFGSLVKQRMLGQTADQADWLIGAGLLGDDIQGKALRSMKEPGTAFDDPLLGKDPQPGHMRDYADIIEDNGGVHINSGIPNRAFYLVASELGGNAWETPGRIWYQSLLDPQVHPTLTFAEFARITVATASRYYGQGSNEESVVRRAWAEVGLEVAGMVPAMAVPGLRAAA